MKICFLMPSHWSAGLGGAEVQVRLLMDYLRQQTDHELSMICQSTKMNEEQGVPILRTTPLRPLARYFKTADFFSVRKLLRRLRPDVIYTRRGTPLVGIAAQYCRHFDKCLVFHIAHIDDVTRPHFRERHSIPKMIERPLYEYGLRRAHIIIAQAKYQAELLHQNYGLSCSAILPNYHPVPADVQKIRSGQNIIWVANLKKSKQPEVFINLARECQLIENTKFIMIGAMQDDRYVNLMEEASELTNFSYLGPQSLDSVNRHLASGQLFVNTSKIDGEGFPNSFIQAWLRGVPVVSLEVDPDEVLKNHKMGISCDGSFVKLVAVIKSLAQNSDELRSLATGVRDLAIDMYSDRNFDSLVTLIEDAHRGIRST